jgi:hypothetical protein
LIGVVEETTEMPGPMIDLLLLILLLRREAILDETGDLLDSETLDETGALIGTVIEVETETGIAIEVVIETAVEIETVARHTGMAPSLGVPHPLRNNSNEEPLKNGEVAEAMTVDQTVAMIVLLPPRGMASFFVYLYVNKNSLLLLLDRDRPRY